MDSLPLLQPLLAWLLKTRMSFYQYDLQLRWWFGLACWNYAIAGLVTLWVEPRQHELRMKFPYEKFAWLLICVQAPLSFAADYLHMEHDSYWHVLDRCWACPLTLLEASRVVVCIWQQYEQWKNDVATINVSQSRQWKFWWIGSD